MTDLAYAGEDLDVVSVQFSDSNRNVKSTKSAVKEQRKGTVVHI